MSRATVRAAVAAWFAPPNVAKLNRVDVAKTRNFKSQTLYSGTDRYGVTAYVRIETVREERITAPAVAGKKRLDYDVALVFLFRSKARAALDAMSDLDTFIEALKTRLRADPRLGQADTVIWQAGQQLLEVITDDEQYDATQQVTWGALRFDVTEWITA